MIGNKYKGDDIAREFQKLLVKKAEEQGEGKKVKMDKPEDFLVSAPEESEVGQHISKVLDNSVDSLDNFAKDKPKKKEDEKEEKKEEKEEEEEKEEKEDEEEESEEESEEKDEKKKKEDDAHDLKKDFSKLPFLVGGSQKEVLRGLGKIAANLRSEGKGLAADMVEVTAQDIVKDLVSEAHQKLMVISTLEQMANELGQSDKFASDMIKVTIEKIKSN